VLILNYFHPDQSTERENIFLSIGRIQQQKGQLETLKFLNSFKEIETDFKCYFVGGPSGSSGEEYLLELKKIVKDLSLDSYVEFLGNLPQVDITNLLNRSKLLIHTSQYETFGLVAIEANSTGVPVLTSNTGSMNEIIVNNKNGYLAKDLFDSNVNTFVKDVLNNDKKFDEIKMNCIEKSKKYDWLETAKNTENLYRHLV
jgi:D-inositol-3-phosphate glycosyltransferase